MSVVIPAVFERIQARLGGRVVGYACCLGSLTEGVQTAAHGDARTAADGTVQPFTSSTKFQIASCSKTLTALAALKLLAGPEEPVVGTVIGPSLPADWQAAAQRNGVGAITFGELLCHRSGIVDADQHPQVGNGQNYEDLKTFLTSPTIDLSGKDTYSYSNVGFALFRILIPLLAGFSDDLGASDDDRAASFAMNYVLIVNREVFAPVGVSGLSTSPPSGGRADAYALAYAFPGGSPGYDWGTDPVPPLPLTAGAGGWWLSVEDFAAVLDSLNRNDGKILTPTLWGLMQGLDVWDPAIPTGVPLGFDAAVTPGPPTRRWIEKDGGVGANGTTLTASIALFGNADGTGPIADAPLFGALLINSEVGPAGANEQPGWMNCFKCGALAFIAENPGPCPAGGVHTSPGGNYLLNVNAPATGAVAGWNECSACRTLVSNQLLGFCSATHGMHAFGSDPFFVFEDGGSFPRERQSGWKVCQKCGVLVQWYGPTFTCAAGGEHLLSGKGSAGDYFIDAVPDAPTVLLESIEAAIDAFPEQIVALDAGGHLRELFSHDGTIWETGDLTAIAEATPAVTASSLSGYQFPAGSSKQVAYLDSDANVNELAVAVGANWAHTNLTSAAGAPAAAPGSRLSGYAWDLVGTKQVVYLGTAGHVHELADAAGRSWEHADLTAITPGATPASGTEVCGYQWTAGRSKQVAYLDAGGQVGELYVRDGGKWAHGNLSEMSGAPAAAKGSALSAYQWLAANSKQVVYLDPAGHVHELSVVHGAKGWVHADLTTATGAPPAIAGSPLVGYEWQAGNCKQVVYLDPAGHVHELFAVEGQKNWGHVDLTERTGAPAAVAGSALSAYEWAAAPSKQVVFIGTDGHLHRLWIRPRYNWAHTDLTAAAQSPAPVSGTALTGYEWLHG